MMLAQAEIKSAIHLQVRDMQACLLLLGKWCNLSVGIDWGLHLCSGWFCDPDQAVWPVQRGLLIICTAQGLWEPGSFWAFGVHSPTQQALNRNLDDSARCLLTALWPAGAPRKNENRELKACYSSTAREFNCESMNLNLWRGLWALHVSVYPPVSTVHLLFLMWFLNHSGKLLMKLIGCLSYRSLLLLFTGYLHPHSTPATACSHPDDTRKYTKTQRWMEVFVKTMSKCVLPSWHRSWINVGIKYADPLWGKRAKIVISTAINKVSPAAWTAIAWPSSTHESPS